MHERSTYKTFHDIGLSCGPAFQAHSNICADPDKKLTSADGHCIPQCDPRKGFYTLHPASFDATFQQERADFMSRRQGEVCNDRLRTSPFHHLCFLEAEGRVGEG